MRRGASRRARCARSLVAAVNAPANDSSRLGVALGAGVYLAATAAGVRCDGAWDASEACCVPAAQRTPAGDVPFVLDALRAILAATPAADPRRVFIAGVSAGAFMALRVGCDAPAGVIAGVLAYAGGGVPACAPAAPLPLLLVHGRRDLQVPFGGSGGNGGGAASFSGAEATLKDWALRGARCDAAVPPTRTTRAAAPGDGNSSRLEVVSYTAGCAAQPVEGWLLDTWGHLPPTAGQEMDAVFVAAFRRISGGG
jgi:polyhydroxybutyrate depolymerase